MDSAIDAIDNRVDTYIRRQGLADIANPSDVEQPGLRLRLGYADIEAHRDVGDIAPTARRRMCGRDEGPFYNLEYDAISKNRVIEELSAAGVAPAEPGTPEFDAYIGNGEREINWAVLMDGRLVILPIEVDVPGEGMVPTGHAALTGDVPKTGDWVQTAGLARIQKTDEGYQGMTIHNYSGHYRPTLSSLVLHALPRLPTTESPSQRRVYALSSVLRRLGGSNSHGVGNLASRFVVRSSCLEELLDWPPTRRPVRLRTPNDGAPAVAAACIRCRHCFSGSRPLGQCGP
jgi:hypothetical protein